MTKRGAWLIVIGLVAGACDPPPPPPPPAGSLDLTWSISLDGVAKTCAEITPPWQYSYAWIDVSVHDPTGDVPLVLAQRFNCAPPEGTTEEIAAGDYVITVSLGTFPAREGSIGDQQVNATVTSYQITHLGHFTFAFFSEDCAVVGDEDGDGSADCADPDCAGAPACQTPSEDCAVVGDEDGDGSADCADPDCAGAPACQMPMEDCAVVGDEDGDGSADCADPDCAGAPACQPSICGPPLVTIAMVYDNAGQGGAAFNQNFVVLKNRSAAPYDLTGHSLQTAGYFMTNWEKHDLPAESIPANGYYLIGLNAAGPDGADLPTPDVEFPTAYVSTVTLVVALMPNTTLLAACPVGAVDLFSSDHPGCTEGTTVPAPGTDGPPEWYARGDAGCADTDVNSADFAVAAAGSPPSSGSAAIACTCL